MRALTAAALLLACLGAQGAWGRDLAQARDSSAMAAPAAEGAMTAKVGQWASDSFPMFYSSPTGSNSYTGARLLPLNAALPRNA